MPRLPPNELDLILFRNLEPTQAFSFFLVQGRSQPLPIPPQPEDPDPSRFSFDVPPAAPNAGEQQLRMLLQLLGDEIVPLGSSREAAVARALEAVLSDAIGEPFSDDFLDLNVTPL